MVITAHRRDCHIKDLSIFFPLVIFCQNMVVLLKNLAFPVFQNKCIETSLLYSKAVLFLFRIFEYPPVWLYVLTGATVVSLFGGEQLLYCLDLGSTA